MSGHEKCSGQSLDWRFLEWWEKNKNQKQKNRKKEKEPI